jgi:hypothetical protein
MVQQLIPAFNLLDKMRQSAVPEMALGHLDDRFT